MKRYLIILLITFAVSGISCTEEFDLFDSVSGIKSIAKEDSTRITLKYKEAILINEELILVFDEVTADSRCPIDVMCFWAGDGEVRMKLKRGFVVKDFTLHTTLDPKYHTFENYTIELAKLMPSRKSYENLKRVNYSVELVVKYGVTNQTRMVEVVDPDKATIKKDGLVVNDVTLNKNILSMSVSYGGGCKDHIIDLIAYSGIMKSNPPQMNLVLSHNANNDMCEAYITRKMQFDLTNVKNYLGSQVGGKVILHISDPAGNEIKQSPVTYIF